MKERKERDLSKKICFVVLGLREATYGTKDTVAGYNGTKATQATTVNKLRRATMTMAVHNRMKGYDGTKGYAGYNGREQYEKI